MSNYLNTHKRNNLGFSLSSEIQHQVDLLALENAGLDPDTPLYDIDQMDEAVANDTVEDRSDIEESQVYREATEEAQGQINDSMDELDDCSDAIVTMESLTNTLNEACRYGQPLSVVSTHFARAAVASSLDKIGISRQYAFDAIPDLQSINANHTQVTLLGVMDSIKTTLFSAWEKTLIVIRKRILSQTKHIQTLEKRLTKLGAKAQEFKGNKQTGDILSATSENIALAQHLFVGPTNNRVEEIFTRLAALQKLVSHFSQSSLPKIDKLSMQLMDVRPGADGMVDGGFTKTLNDIFSDFKGQRVHNPINHSEKIVTQQFIGAYQFEIVVPEVVKKLTIADFVNLSDGFGLDYCEDNYPSPATAKTWHNFVLMGLDTDQVARVMDSVKSVISVAKTIDESYKHHANFGSQLFAKAKKEIGVNDGGAAIPRSFAKGIVRIWFSTLQAMSTLLDALLDNCDHLLTYVGKSMSKWEFFKSRGVGDVATEVGKVAATGLLPKAAFSAAGALSAGAGEQLQLAREFVKRGRRASLLLGAGSAIRSGGDIYRRHSWDKHARIMGHGEQ